MITITSKEFIETIISEKVTQKSILDDITINSKMYKNEYLILENIHFRGKLEFNGVDFIKGIKFSNCEFHSSVKFIDCRGDGFVEEDDPDRHTIKFSNCEFLGDVEIISSNFKYGIVFKSNCTLQNIEIKRSEIKGGHLTFNRSTINKEIKINLEYIHSINIQDCQLNSNLHLSDVNSQNVIIQGSTIFKDLNLIGGKYKNITFWRNKFKSSLYLIGMNIEECLGFSVNDFDNDVHISLFDVNYGDEGYIKTLSISNSKLENDLIVEGRGRIIDTLQIELSSRLSGSYSFKNIKNISVNLTNDNHNGNIIFDSCSFKSLSFKSFNNYKNVTFLSNNEPIKDSHFELVHSSLGRTKFFNFDFNSFTKIKIIDSILTDIETSIVHWFDDKKLDVGENTIKGYKKKREVYRQIKQVLEKQGAKIDSLEIKARELKAFKNEISKTNRYSDRFILWFSQTNDFGLKWHWPLGLIFGITVVFYWLMVVASEPSLSCIPAYSFTDASYSANVFMNNLHILPQLFNPARSLDKVFNSSELPRSLYWLDATHRIILAFFIFQIIVAFRKYYR